ncbi:MAG: MFS transporter [Elusimicrobia bacterium]|nr:MFS transporter [Elusimicrobiota bacterium]
MKRLVGAVIAAVLLWTSGPLPAFAGQVVSAGTGKAASTPTVGNPAAGSLRAVPGIPGAVLAPLQAPTFAPGLGLPGLGAPGVQAAADVSVFAVPGAIAPEVLPVAVPAASLGNIIPVSEPSSQPVDVSAGRAVVTSQDSPSVGLSAPDSQEQAGTSAKTLRSLGSSLAEQEQIGGNLDRTYDGSLARKADPVSPTFWGRIFPYKVSTSLVKPTQIVPSTKGETPGLQAPTPEKPKGSIPVSYYLYLAGQYLYALGQEATSLIAPLYAYAAQGLAFAVTTQAAFLLAILPGSLLGARWVKRFDAKRVYVAGNIVHGLFVLSVPVNHVLTGVFSPVHFMLSNLVAGFIYGSLRGVAEKEIAPRIMGQGDRDGLNKAGALFYAAFEGAELTAALIIGALIPILGLNPTAAVMSGMMLLSALPLALMRLNRGREGEEEKGGTETSLPKTLYLPYIFTVFSHLSLYMFLSPFLALEVFHKAALNGAIVAFYTVGSLVVALATAYLPKVGKALSERGWAAVGIGAMIAFLAASLLLQSLPLTLGAAFLLGVGLTAMQIQWRSLYQQRLSLSAQPHVFQWLSIIPVMATLPPFVFMQAGLFMGWSMPVLLAWLAVAITAVSLGVPLVNWLVKRLKKPGPPAQGPSKPLTPQAR